MKKLLDAGPSERGWHRIENILRCPRLHAYREIDGREFPTTTPLINGSLLHIGLAHHYQQMKERQEGGDPDQWLDPADAIEGLARKNGQIWMNAIPLITEAYFGYRNNWLGENWKILSVEEELRAHVGSGKWLYTQRADLIVEDVHQRVWIVDHKSAYRINSKTLTQYIMDGQFVGYQMFGRAKYGERFAGVLLNRVKLSPPFDFDRRALEPAPAALTDFVKVIEEAERRVAQYEGKETRDYPMSLTNQICYGKYGKCRAFDLCRFGTN